MSEDYGEIGLEQLWTAFFSSASPLSRSGRALLGQILDLGVRGVLLDRLDALLQGCGRGVHLAAAEGLAVGGLEDEVVLLLGRLALIAAVVLRVLPHGLDSAVGAPLLLVGLAGQDHLPVGSMEV